MTSTQTTPAVYNYLTTDKDDLAALVGTNISKNKLEKRNLKGSGESAIVIRTSGGDIPRGNSLGNPRVNIFIYSDHTRVNGEVTEEDAEDRMWAIFHVVDAYMHWPDRERRLLDGLDFIGSLRGIAPQILDDKDVGLPYLWTAYDMNRIY